MAPPPLIKVRRSNRASLPNTHLLYRRQIIRENFCKTAVQTTKKKPNGKFSAIKLKTSAKVQNKNYNTKKKQCIDHQTKQTKLLNGNSCSGSSGGDNSSDALTSPPPTFDDELATDKMEKLDNTTNETGIPKSFGTCLKFSIENILFGFRDHDF